MRFLQRSPQSLLLFAAIAISVPATSAAQSAPDTAASARAEQGVNARREPLTLDEALSLAEERAPTLAIARSETETAILRRFQAKMERVPQITLTAAAGPGPIGVDRVRADGSVEEEIRFIGGITLGGEARIVVPVSTFGKVKLAKELAEMGIDAAELAEDVARLEARYEAYRAFTGLQWFYRMAPVIAEVEGRMAQAKEMLEDRLDDGDFTARTSLRQLTIFSAEIVKMRGDLNQVGFLAQQAMRLVLGLPEDTPVTEFEELQLRSDDLPAVATLVEYAQQHRPDYRRLQIAVDAADQAVRLQRRMGTPNAFFQARGGVIYTPTVDGAPGFTVIQNRFNDLNGEIMLGLRWDIQPGRQRAAVLLAEQRAQTVRAQQQGAVVGLELQIREAHMNAQQQLELVIAQNDARRAAEAWLNTRALQFDQGLASFEDLVDPLKAYYESLAAYFEALLRYKLHVANLGMLVGWDDPTSLPN